MTRQLPGWTVAIAKQVAAERAQREADQYTRDITKLRILGAAFTGQPAWQHDTLYDQLLADLSGEARRAVTAEWPATGFKTLWDAA
jgi:hypothetical protein